MSERGFDIEKIKLHISKGAQLSNTVHNFLVSKKVITGKKVNALPKRTALKKEEVKEETKAEEKKIETKVEEAPAEKTETVETKPVEVASETP